MRRLPSEVVLGLNAAHDLCQRERLRFHSSAMVSSVDLMVVYQSRPLLPVPSLWSTSNIGGWTGFLGSFQLPLAEDVDMAVVLRELFCPPPLSPPTASPPSRSKSRGARRGAKKKTTAAAGDAKEAAAANNAGKDKRGKNSSRESKRKR